MTKSLHYYEDQKTAAGNMSVREDTIYRYVTLKQSTREIAEHYDISSVAVCNRLNKWGIRLRPRGGANYKLQITLERYNSIMEADGRLADIGEKFEVSAPTVSRLKRGYTPKFITELDV